MQKQGIKKLLPKLRDFFSASVERRFWSKVDRSGGPDACWPWLGAGVHYGNFYIGQINGRSCFVNSHIVAWVLSRGRKVPKGKQICHNCPRGDNSLCCNPRHLWCGTPQQNMDDMHAKGRFHSRQSLTADQVAEIRRRYVPRTITQAALAKEFGVDQATICNVLAGKFCYQAA